MRRIAVLFPALLLACAAPPPGAYREADRAIYSTAVLEPGRLEGRWYQVADFAPARAPECRASGLTVLPEAQGALEVQADLCLGGARTGYRGAARISGPGRLMLSDADPAGIGAEWWVLWVDADDRTLVVGTPGGGFGLILDRAPEPSSDRMRAAREILAWNGYDLAQLRPVTPP